MHVERFLTILLLAATLCASLMAISWTTTATPRAAEAVLLPLAFSQIGLAVMWLTLGRRHLMWRWLLLAVCVGGWSLTGSQRFTAQESLLPFALTIQASVLGAALVIFRFSGFGVWFPTNSAMPYDARRRDTLRHRTIGFHPIGFHAMPYDADDTSAPWDIGIPSQNSQAPWQFTLRHWIVFVVVLSLVMSAFAQSALAQYHMLQQVLQSLMVTMIAVVLLGTILTDVAKRPHRWLPVGLLVALFMYGILAWAHQWRLGQPWPSVEMLTAIQDTALRAHMINVLAGYALLLGGSLMVMRQAGYRFGRLRPEPNVMGRARTTEARRNLPMSLHRTVHGFPGPDSA
jgi:hypothetical protein